MEIYIYIRTVLFGMLSANEITSGLDGRASGNHRSQMQTGDVRGQQQEQVSVCILNRSWRFDLLLNTRLGTRWGLTRRRMFGTEPATCICAKNLIKILEMTYRILKCFSVLTVSSAYIDSIRRWPSEDEMHSPTEWNVRNEGRSDRHCQRMYQRRIRKSYRKYTNRRILHIV